MKSALIFAWNMPFFIFGIFSLVEIVPSRSWVMNRHTFTSRVVRTQPLEAKKKKTLASDSLLSLLEEQYSLEEEEVVKEKSLTPEISSQSTSSTKIKKQKQNKGEVLQPSNESLELIEPVEVISERKAKPASKIRLVESAQPDFVMLGLEEVSMMFGNEIIVKNSTFSVTTGERIGLVGPNGAGKSTQLKILSGELEPLNGRVVKSSTGLRVAFLRQEFLDELVMHRSLREELLSAFVEENKVLEALAKSEVELESATADPVKMEDILNRMQELQERALSMNAYALDSKALKALTLMGFTEEDLNSRVDSFSGGWKMRIGLAKILCVDPNVLLLDEPTNHMDLDSVAWLEGFLRSQNIPMIIVSHDREFLDQVCNKIVEIEEGVSISYTGNYSKFLELRQLRLEQWREKYDKQMRFVSDEEKWIRNAKNDENLASAAKTRESALEKLKESEEWIPQPPKDRRFRFRFPPALRSSSVVLEARKLSHGYGEGKYKVLFKDVSFDVEKGMRIGFVGPNGSGKSTMLKIIMGVETANEGYVEFGSGNIVPAYYAQNQVDTLDLDHTVLESVMDAASGEMSITDVRTLLGQFMFKGEDVQKKIRSLSGGEKARVALCRIMLTPANLLLMDEPTNHLDITAKEVLEEALLSYGGAVLIVSHDRYFMSQVVNTIFEFKNKAVTKFDCDFHDYTYGISENSAMRDKIEARYVSGDKYKLTNAKEVVVVEEKQAKSRNFGGSGVTSGNLNKGIKNAKRFSNK